MNWLQCALYGFISGLTEFIPVSSRAHQAIVLELFGQSSSNPILDVLVHIAVLVGIYFSQRSTNYQSSAHHGSRGAPSSMERRLVNCATIPMLIGILLLTYLTKSNKTLPFVAVFSLINGLILFIPGRLLRGNKDARSMSALDGILIGLAGALSAFAGVSRVGAAVSLACVRGAHRSHALNWAISLSVPALCIWLLVDFFRLITAFQPVGFLTVLCYLLAAISAFAGTYMGIRFVKTVTARISFPVFAYYSWGVALFAFILYLI